MSDQEHSGHSAIELVNRPPGLVGLSELAEAIALDLQLEDANSVFFLTHTDHRRGYVATCLLRLLGREGGFEGEIPLRAKAWDFLDRTLERTYAAIGISAGDQNFKKEAALSAFLPTVEANLRRIGEQVNPASFRRNREAMLKEMKQASLRPMALYLYPSVVTDQIQRLADACVAYGDASGRLLLDSYREVQGLAEDVVGKLPIFDPLQQAMLEVVTRFSKSVEQHFSTTTAGKPAKLGVALQSKKYPLWDEGREFALQLRMTNEGVGPALEVALHIEEDTGNVEVLDRSVDFGDLTEMPMTFQLPCRVHTPEGGFLVKGRVVWSDITGTPLESEFELDVEAQPRSVPWQSLEASEPYSLEPVVSEDELFGRSETLSQMRARMLGPSVGSFWLWGQRRVGKTSVAKTLKAQLDSQSDISMVVIYAEAGDYVNPDPTATIRTLGELLCEELVSADPALSGLAIPSFEDSLTPLATFLRQASRMNPALRVVFILDEFDRLPPELYQRGSLSQAFFLSLRSISGKSQYGFVLVGGETMDLILSLQGQELNKFDVIRLDYLDRESHFGDFSELVRRPIEPWFEVDDSALITLHDLTAGNPYFTKLVGHALFADMVRRRDTSITSKEIREAAALSIRSISANSFQHFWDDRILVPGSETDMSIQRRKLLASLATCLQVAGGSVSRDHIIEHAPRFGVGEALATQMLDDFQSRGVLAVEGEQIAVPVRLFEMWLKEKGVRELLVGLGELTRAQHEAMEAEPLAIQSSELVQLVELWPSYQGRVISPEDARAWLDQFGVAKEQRVVFKLLKHLRFYSSSLIRERLKDGHAVVRRGLTQVIDSKRTKRSDILVTYLGALGKSSMKIARLYADEANIYTHNVLALETAITRVVDPADEANTLVILDDFIGTGNTLRTELTNDADLFRQINGTGARVFLIVVCGTDLGAQVVERTIDDLALPIELHVMDRIGEESKCLSPNAGIFDTEDERLLAERVLRQVGERLTKGNPLGFGDGQLLVAFEDTVPNNTISPLWCGKGEWRPLLRRPI